jgi:hypothetical protein
MLLLPWKYLLLSICTCCISLFMYSLLMICKSLTSVREFILPLRIFILHASRVYQVFMSLLPCTHCLQRPHILHPYRSIDLMQVLTHGFTPAAYLDFHAPTYVCFIASLPYIFTCYLDFLSQHLLHFLAS